jgi:lipopolysaccharide/colanic/teichoic acid biosynthesis glycosyltransferase
VVTGDVSLVGVPPLSAAEEDALTEEWERLRFDAPVGLLGPTQLTLPAGAPPEEERLTDALYARTRTRAGDLSWLLRGAAALFSKSAWARPPRRA